MRCAVGSLGKVEAVDNRVSWRMVEGEVHISFGHVRSELGCGVCLESLKVALRICDSQCPGLGYSKAVEGAYASERSGTAVTSTNTLLGFCAQN